MVEQFTSDVRTLLDRSPFDQNTVADLKEALTRDPSRYSTLRDAISAIRERFRDKMSEEVLSRLGVAHTLMGQHSHALECLNQIRNSTNGLVHYFRGLALENQQKWADAIDAFTKSAAANYDVRNSRLHHAGCLRRSGKPDQAKAILDEMAGLETAEYFYQIGSLMAASGDLK
jgi:DNA-directed RNA polymerase subunit alpha